MAEPSKPSMAARMAIIYITIGALLGVWSGIWYFYLKRHDGSELLFYWCYGFFFTGLTLMIIGLALGRIGRAARHAEAPPDSPVPPRPAAPATYFVPQGYIPTPQPPAAIPVPPAPPPGPAPR